MDEHLDMCVKSGLEITGTNMEVCKGQSEYQILSKGRKIAGDELWISRYILYRVTEQYDIEVSLHPKPIFNILCNSSGLASFFPMVNFPSEL